MVLTDQQKWFWVVQLRELGGDIFQEYPATPEEAFTASRDGSYWSRKFNEVAVRQGRVVEGLYDPNLDVDIYCDLGVDDYFVMGAVQWYRGAWRLIAEYKNDGYDITHYIDWAEEQGWTIANYCFPHDIAVRELGSKDAHGKAKSRYDIVRDYFKANNIRSNIRKLPKGSIANGIEAVRLMLDNLWVDPSCTYVIDCIHNYSREWDEKLQQWKQTPRHDEYSHGADMLRMVASSTIESESVHSSRLANNNRPQRTRSTSKNFSV